MSILPLPAAETPFEPLTPRETSILALLAEGLSDREIAERLIVALTTVKWYNRQIFNKLGVDNRRAAIDRARVGRLIETGSPVILPKHNIPAQITPFVGREPEVRDIIHHLRDHNTRLVTILAPGGMGKTRLALAAAESLLLDFPNGVYFVPLVTLTTPEEIIPALADHTGYQFQADKRAPRRQVLDYLGNKTALLVLDNFEHLVAGAALVAELLTAAPHIKTLVTSREKLNLSGETVYLLGGLPIPDAAGTNALTVSAAQLFSQCAQRVRPDFMPDKALTEITEICQLVQGMPLALELAAAWLEVISPAEIAAEIRRSLDFLATDMRDLPERQRSIRAVFDTTWNRLPSEQQTVFMKLTVFQGDWTRAAAETIAGANLRILTVLVDKALVWRKPDGRYLVHELLRQYAAERLEQSGQAALVRDAHCVYYAILVAACEADLKGRRQLSGLLEIEAEFENIRAAWVWAAQSRNLDDIEAMRESLYLFCDMRRRKQDYAELVALAQTQLAPQSGEIPRTAWVRLLVRTPPEAPNAAETIQRGIDIARQNDDQWAVAAGLMQLGAVAALANDYATAAALCQECLPYYRAAGDVFYLARCLNDLAGNVFYDNRWDEACVYFQECIPLLRASGNRLGLALALWGLGGALDTLSRFDEGEPCFREAVAIAQEMGHRYLATSVAGWHLTWREVAKGDMAAAYRLAEDLLAMAIEMNHQHMQGRAVTVLGMLALEEEDYEQARELGEEGLRLLGQHPLNDLSQGVIAQASPPLGDWVTARAYILWKVINPFYKPGDPLNVWEFDSVAIHAYWLAQAGQKERAAEWFGLTTTCPFMPGSRLYPTLRRQLQTDLGEAVYAAALERGRNMNLVAALRQLQQEIIDSEITPP